MCRQCPKQQTISAICSMHPLLPRQSILHRTSYPTMHCSPLSLFLVIIFIPKIMIGWSSRNVMRSIMYPSEIIDTDWSIVFSNQFFLNNDHWWSSVIVFLFIISGFIAQKMSGWLCIIPIHDASLFFFFLCEKMCIQCSVY